MWRTVVDQEHPFSLHCHKRRMTDSAALSDEKNAKSGALLSFQKLFLKKF